MHRLRHLFLAAALCAAIYPSAALADKAREPLKGGVDQSGEVQANPLTPLEPMPAPVMKQKPIEGTIKKEDHALSGSAEDEDGNLQSMTGKQDPDSGVLKGNASLDGGGLLQKQDPDVDDRELMVQWDKWRNRFLQAVQAGVQEQLNNPSESNLRWDPQTQMMVMRFPLGTVAWFGCKITDQKQIVGLKLLHSSGFPNFDKAVLESVNNLNGSSILKYPARSRRTVVSQSAGVKTSENSEQQYFKFGDVERYRSGE